ncbi:chloride channel protein, CIC family [Tangfeifania diversioriginum]|uniref:Chloride channel protein, CIC family n=2 Tax=Tangfeifania diversioriginum TaxID=1168035 RepID=A0A1M6CRK1_9BACT|nr:chloride channel protein, CIC family [Tangfeifania diversioriginum]
MFRMYRILGKKAYKHWLNKLIVWRIARIPEKQFIYILSLIVGVVSGLAALALKNLIHFIAGQLTSWFDSDSISYLYLVYPLVGIFFTALFVRFIVKDNIGHGVSKILYSISRQNSRLRRHNTWSSMIASSFTIGFGGSVGAEAPVVLTGASIGSNLARLFKLNYKYITLMIGCGAAGGIAGIFNAPIAGIVFTLEVLMLDLTMAHLIPLLISSVTATILSYFFMGEGVLLRFSLVNDFNVDNVWFYILLGIFSGLVAIYFTRMTMFVESRFKKIKSWGLRLLLGGIVMGVMVFVFPPLWGEGYTGIVTIFNGQGNELLNNSMFFSWKNNEYLIVLFLAGVLIFKVIAMAATTGSGGVGGIFAPTLFMGAVAGFFFAKFLNISNSVMLPEDNFALAGMAGMMAAVMHAPLTAIFLTAEITRGYDMFIPLIITSTAAYLTIMRFEPHSVYTKQLAKSGDLITHHKDKAVLKLMEVRQLIETDFEELSTGATLGDLVKAISHSKRNLYPVVDPNRVLHGMVKLADVKNLIFEQELYDKVKVKDLMYMPEHYISPTDTMEKVAEKFESSGRYNLAVIDNGKYLGFISRAVAFSKYRKMLQDFSNE